MGTKTSHKVKVLTHYLKFTTNQAKIYQYFINSSFEYSDLPFFPCLPLNPVTKWWYLGKPSPKKSPSVWKKIKEEGGGLCLNPNFLRNLLLLFFVYRFLMQGGSHQNPNLLRNFFAWVWTFSREGVCDKIRNTLRNLYSLCFDVFPDILGRLTKIQTFWGTLVYQKKGLRFKINIEFWEQLKRILTQSYQFKSFKQWRHLFLWWPIFH